MRAFFDTSALAKRYVLESGTPEIQRLIEEVAEISVSPTFLVEFHSLVERRFREKTITDGQKAWLKEEILKDSRSFYCALWDQKLVENSLRLVSAYSLATLDAIQLASACMIDPDIFVTSDKALFKCAKMEMKNAVLVE